MSFWSNVSFNLAVLINLLVAFFYPLDGMDESELSLQCPPHDSPFLSHNNAFEHLNLTHGVFQVHWILLFLCCCGCVCWAHWVLCWCHRGRTQCESWSSPLFCSWGSQWACSICWHSWELLMYNHKYTWEGFILSAYNHTLCTQFLQSYCYYASLLTLTSFCVCTGL